LNSVFEGNAFVKPAKSDRKASIGVTTAAMKITASLLVQA